MTRWGWRKVGTVHGGGGGCTGEVRVYRYRLYPPGDVRYERCVGLTWCSTCREYRGDQASVAGNVELHDVRERLAPAERERIGESEVRLLDFLDRLARRGQY